MDKYFSATTSTTDDILKAEVIRDVIWGLADDMLEFKEAVVLKEMTPLEYHFTLKEGTKIDPQQIAEGSRADFRKISWFDVRGSLEKWQTPILMTDEAKARQLNNLQLSMSITDAAEGLAFQKDADIAAALTAAAGNTNAATDGWNVAATADPAQDIAVAIGDIISSTTLPASAIAQIKLFYPAALLGHVAKPIQVGEIQESIRNWTNRENLVSLYPTRQLTTDALCVVQSERNAIHMAHDGSTIPGYEEWREPGVGTGYLITQYFDTIVLPSVKGGSTNNYICEITDVVV